MDRIFKRLPLMLAVSIELPNPGDFKTMEILGQPYLFRDLEDLDHWAEDKFGMADAMALYQIVETLPIITVDDVAMTYPEAMKRSHTHERRVSHPIHRRISIHCRKQRRP